MTRLLTCTIAGKPLGIRDLKASVDQDPNSCLTGSVTAMNFTRPPRASAELLWFHAPSNVRCCWSADLRGPGMHSTFGAGCELVLWPFSRSQEPVYNQKLANLKKFGVPSRKVHMKTLGTGTGIQICWEQTGLLTMAGQKVLVTIGILWCFTLSPNWSQGAHTICRRISDCNEPFFFYIPGWKKGWEKALGCHFHLFKYS